jgi:chaperonin GroEL
MLSDQEIKEFRQRVEAELAAVRAALAGNAGGAVVELGVNRLADAVRTTIGPKGRYVVVSRGYDTPLITKDGMTVAQQIELEDRFENAAAQALKEASVHMADAVGDGTTTATVISQSIIQHGMRFITAGLDPTSLKSGIDAAAKAATAELARLSRPCTACAELRRIGMVAANGDHAIADILSEAFRQVGANGIVTIEERASSVDKLSVTEGTRFDSGFLPSTFATDALRQPLVFENACIAVLGDAVSNPDELLPLLEKSSMFSFHCCWLQKTFPTKSPIF